MKQTESKVLGFDFVNDIGEEDTIASAVWTVTVIRGTDSNPSNLLQGPPRLVTPNGSTLQTATVQQIGSVLPDVTYALEALATTTLGEVVSLYSHVRGENVQ